ncbi:hypothetical protein B0H17DRAFT_1261940 [Mycena rosella]|uniref:Uncharacterized protein n=1 Tax=Mycena rosella TaxID=1033263 RepID=A0AAD7CQU5_MYCRO|nr:hypothetical protein B0H17DRAFT_1261940 [Mycena rosella]
MADPFNENPTNLYTEGHLTLFRDYRLHLRVRTAADPQQPTPNMYNAWVYELREKYGNGHPSVPRFSPDYVGAVPGVAVPSNPVETGTGDSVALKIVNKLAESHISFSERSNEVILRQMEQRNRGRHGRFHSGRGARKVDTYYGGGARKRSRSRSAYARRTRARHGSRSYLCSRSCESARYYRSVSRDSDSAYHSALNTHGRSTSKTTVRSTSPGDRTPRGQRLSRSPSRRPSSRSMDAVARRSMERQFQKFQAARLVENDAIKEKRALDAQEKAAKQHSEDVEMTPAPEIQRDATGSSNHKTSDKGKAKDPAEGKGLGGESASGSGSVEADNAGIEFLDLNWALDNDGNFLPPLPSPGDGDEF